MTFISYRCIYTVIWILIVIHFNLPGNFKILTSIFSHTLYWSLTVNFGILNTISKQIPWICLWGSRRSIYLCTSVFHILNMPIFFFSPVKFLEIPRLDFNFNAYVIPLGIPISWLGSSVTGDIKVILRANSSFFIKLSVRGSTVKISNWLNNL